MLLEESPKMTTILEWKKPKEKVCEEISILHFLVSFYLMKRKMTKQGNSGGWI